MGERIPLVNETVGTSGLGANGMHAIMFELSEMLEDLVTEGRSAQIDLRALPLTLNEHDSLKARLGIGEVEIEMDLCGRTLCHETAIPAVWWVEHFNHTGDIVAEFIEVARIPDIVKYDSDELQLGLTRLYRQLETDCDERGVSL
ncbi:MAG: hydrogenase expression/formation protein [Gammaproteobacteria bacterium]|nr:hydrogenase expression/formation protein [Gammaproteobacteria bacterium]